MAASRFNPYPRLSYHLILLPLPSSIYPSFFSLFFVSSSPQVVIVQTQDSTKTHAFPHAIVAGVERYPLKVTKAMGEKRMTKRSKVKPFIKVINLNHLMITRYNFELDGIKGTVSNDTFKEVEQRKEAKLAVKKALQERYLSGKNRWFFTALSKWE